MKETRKNIHDTDGFSEQEILSKKEILKILEGISNQNIKELLISEGIFKNGNDSNISTDVRIDARTGELEVIKSSPGTYNDDDSFYIDLWCQPEIEFDEQVLVEDTDMEVEMKQVVVEKFLKENYKYLRIDGCDHLGNICFNWHDNVSIITAEDFITHFLKENYEEYEKRYSDWLLEEVEINFEEVENYYNY